MEIKVPTVGESVFEAVIGKWLKRQGEPVKKDEPICELETEKITLELNAEADGVLNILAAEGTTVKIGATIGMIEPKAAAEAPAAPVVPAAEEAPLLHEGPAPASPAARKIAREEGIALESLTGGGRGGRVRVDDLKHAAAPPPPVVPPVAGPSAQTPPATAPAPAAAPLQDSRTTRKPMTPIRKKITAHLIQAVQQTAMLTTFNEADMGRIMELKRRRKSEFLDRFGFSPGLVSFFVQACVSALREYPEVNARIEGDDIVYHHYCDIGIAIGAEKGLVVPVLRGAESLDFWGTERGIREVSAKVAENRLALSDLEGGTFTITNGGVYGSLLSTPMLNMPQAGVLGMHTVQERPVARDGQIVIRPMMYLALTYDHRLIDGRQAVGFLKRVKEYVEAFDERLLD